MIIDTKHNKNGDVEGFTANGCVHCGAGLPDGTTLCDAHSHLKGKSELGGKIVLPVPTLSPTQAEKLRDNWEASTSKGAKLC